ncbi:alpha-2-macroglobulin-like [Paramacrobiotus metropolitanus]|uniref:alpha-2-macroglobulin-like n=1 Tax=Paramacrobiotus metropolitanus TaxID=2943436 RepID=UPI002445E6F6|nr:alpha-2-macroglobulin-like [Paramacrobiotus metropolitanus]
MDIHLKSLVVITAFVYGASAFDYVIFGPKSLRSSQVLPISILCRNTSSDVKVDVTIQPRPQAYADFQDTDIKNKLTFTQSFLVKPNQLSQLDFKVGDLSVYPTKTAFSMDLVINGSNAEDFFNRAVYSLTVESEESKSVKQQLVFIQTDQPLYKAKDTVRFRIVTVDQQLLPVYAPFTIRVLDPQNNIVKQYSNASDPNAVGFFAGDFLLSTDPLIGAWKIEVRSGDLQKVMGSKQFSVDEYVLPRFDVKISAIDPPVVTIDSVLQFVVDANYTFGEPVKGNLEVKLIEPISSSRRIIGRRSNVHETDRLNTTVSVTDFNGRYKFTVPLSRSVLNPEKKYKLSNLEIRANFTEALTGQTKNATAFVRVSDLPYKLEVTNNASTFSPGHPYTFRALVSDLVGRPLPPSTKKVNIEISFFDKRGYWGTQLTKYTNINKTGNGSDADISPDSFYRGSVGPRLPSWAVSWPQSQVDVINSSIPADGIVDVIFKTPKEARRIEIKVTYLEEEKRFTVKGKESPSSSFLEIKQLSDDLQSGNSATFGINMTTRTNEAIQILVQSNSNSSFLWSNSTSETGPYVVISVPILEAMGLIGRLMVYYVRADKEIVGNIFVLSPTPTMKNTVDVSAEATSGFGYAQPGEEALFKANTSPSAFVAFLAVDESLLLMKTGNDLSADEVNWVISKDRFVIPSDIYSVEDYFDKTYTSGQFILTNNQLPTSREERPWSYHRRYSPSRGRGWGGARSGGSSRFASASSSRKSWSMSASSASSGSVGIPGRQPDVELESFAYTELPPTSKAPFSEESSVENLETPHQTRKDFRQSFLFETAFSNSNGLVELHSKVPDAITTWRISAFSLSNTSGLGLTSTPAKLKVFQPFFAVLNLPFSIVRFENLTAEVLVFNYMSQKQDVTVQLQIRNPDNTTATLKKNVLAKPNEGTTATFTIIPQQIGDLILKVTAQSSFAADQLEKTLPVKPEGVKQYFTKPVFIDLRQSASMSAPITLPSDPAGKVDGSDRVEVRVVGDILGAAMNNLDKLIRLPTGCGEQNMATTVPNLVVAKYLKQLNQLAEPQKSKLLANIQLGYQRELTYRRGDNSYSAWGKSDPKGSTWLTAYVARVFAEAVEFVPSIEDDVIKTALRFLVDQQNTDGSFEENGRVIDKQHQGGASKGIGLTAFTLIAFLQYKESGKPVVVKFDESMQKATNYLESKLNTLSNDSYALAITAYALAKAKSEKNAAALDLLEQKMIRNSSLAYWTTTASLSDQGADEEHSYPTNAKDVEATAYALLAFMANGKVSSALPIVSWLISKQNAEGGFISTQDTVVGLTGLAEFAKVFVNPPSMQIDVKYNDQSKQSVSVTPQTAVILQTIELPKKPKSISLNAQGNGVALAYLSWTYHVGKPKEDVAFDLNITKTVSTADLRMGICSRYTRDGKSSMAVIEVNTLSGSQFDEDELRKLPKMVPGLRKTEMENKDTKLNLYFDELNESATCFKLTMYRIYKVKDLKDQSIVVYDYYNPKERKTVSYNL